MAKSIKSYLGIIHRLGLLAKRSLASKLTSICRVFRRIFNIPIGSTSDSMVMFFSTYLRAIGHLICCAGSTFEHQTEEFQVVV
jgi:hypothetical protein